MLLRIVRLGMGIFAVLAALCTTSMMFFFLNVSVLKCQVSEEFSKCISNFESFVLDFRKHEHHFESSFGSNGHLAHSYCFHLLCGRTNASK
jgi:hypothetical protein